MSDILDHAFEKQFEDKLNLPFDLQMKMFGIFDYLEYVANKGEGNPFYPLLKTYSPYMEGRKLAEVLMESVLVDFGKFKETYDKNTKTEKIEPSSN